MQDLAKLLLVAGGVLLAAGLLLMFLPRLPFAGRLPGDIHLEGKHASFHFPIATCLILSLILTVILNLFFRR